MLSVHMCPSRARAGRKVSKVAEWQEEEKDSVRAARYQGTGSSCQTPSMMERPRRRDQKSAYNVHL